ncbi:MAG: hypothetical protein B1H08_00240 [Candidatus Omnitrophica bacterium 4484_171]|nr:MAG: hypothetical protein B1H08_00240 [Candidatus Omnitrophica bacterium 4484_171]
MRDEVKKHLLGKNIYLDTDFFFDYLPKDEIAPFISGRPEDKILFGTDFPLIDQRKDINALNNIGIPRRLKENIFSRNASSLTNV